MQEQADSRIPFRRRIFTVPNLLSIIRILLIPIIVWLYVGCKRYNLALLMLILSGLTDTVDGYIARHFNAESDIGKVLDPVADKLTQGAVLLCISFTFKPMLYALITHVVKEFLMIVFGLIVLKKTGTVNSAKWYGKACTWVLYVGMALCLVMPTMPEWAASTIAGVCIAVIIASFIMYTARYTEILLLNANKKPLSRFRDDWRTAIAAIVLGAIVACLICCDISAQDIVSFTPNNTLAALGVLLALYLLKSVTVITSVRLLQIAVGIMFPLQWALLINVVGLVITFTIPYLFGRAKGHSALSTTAEQSSFLDKLMRLGKNDTFMASLSVRGVILLPLDPPSMYFGASGAPYLKFLLGSILGSLPTLIVRTVLGESADDVSSPTFIISVVAYVVILVMSILFGMLLKKRMQRMDGEMAG